MDELIKNRIEEWTNPPYDIETISEIKKLVSKNDEKELIERFFKTLEFGTGGLRGIIGAGTNRMNIYTVGFATQGLANYIISQKAQDRGVVIAYDSRRKSDLFSKTAASIFAANGIKVYLYNDIMPTPLCSYAIRELNAISGIVVTASHNPPEYNGYKVYWEDGGQVVSPQDNEIITEVNKINKVDQIKKIQFDDGVKQGKIEIIGEKICQKYIHDLENVSLRKKEDSKIKIVYSPLHGTGYKLMPEVLRYFGFKELFLEPQQIIPDGNFPTVDYPNPEEKAAVKLALDLAKQKNADIVVATDPDADRMGIGFKNDVGEYILISGNQIGTMLEYYLLSRQKESNKLAPNSAVVKTIVTTDLQTEIAKDFNCHIDNVLTGFKWIARKMKDYDENQDYKFIFGGEESYGYLPLNFVRDKDAIASCYFFAEMTDWLQKQGKTLYQFLKEIHLKYSLYMEDLKSLTLKGLDGMQKIQNIMKFFRNNPPTEIAGITVSQILDYQNLEQKEFKNNTISPIKNIPVSNVLQYLLEDGTKVTMRPSGTEPKIKFYFSTKMKTNEQSYEDDKKSLQSKLEKLNSNIIKIAENVE